MTGLDKVSVLEYARNNRTFVYRILFGVLAALVLLGDLGGLIHRLGLGAVYDSANEMLESAMIRATTTLFIATIVKGGLEVMASIEFSPVIGSIEFGGLFSGFLDLVDTIIRFFLVSSALIAAQIGLLSILQIAGFNLFLGGGALLLAANPSLASTAGKLGFLGITLALVLCVVFPILIATMGNALNEHQMDAAIQNAENMGVMKEQMSDINFMGILDRDEVQHMASTFQSGVRQVWDGMMAVMITYIIMFIILPIASLGVCYVIIRYVMRDVMGYDAAVSGADSSIAGSMQWIGQRWGSRSGKGDEAPAGEDTIADHQDQKKGGRE